MHAKGGKIKIFKLNSNFNPYAKGGTTLYFLINKFLTAVQKILVTEKIKDDND